MYSIEIKNLYKKFKKGEKFYSLRDHLPALLKKTLKGSDKMNLNDKEFWALKDINFNVKKGEVLGIIGANGSGKSTLFNILAGLMDATSGEYKVHGRLSALIEVTAGFHPEFTGRQNVYFNGTVLGMSKKNLDAKFEEIVEFSGVREFIDTPVKHYSTGMLARLGFAVAAHVDPDVMLVDEVFAVGDINFQEKCLEKMRSLVEQGVTVVFISHHMAMVDGFCDRIIMLAHGEVIKQGSCQTVIPYYEHFMHLGESAGKKSGRDYSFILSGISKGVVNEIYFRKISSGEEETSFKEREGFAVEIDFELYESFDEPVFSIEIFNDEGLLTAYLESDSQQFLLKSLKGKQCIQVKIEEPSLGAGDYYVKFTVWNKEMTSKLLTTETVEKFSFEITPIHSKHSEASITVPEGNWILVSKAGSK